MIRKKETFHDDKFYFFFIFHTLIAICAICLHFSLLFCLVVKEFENFSHQFKFLSKRFLETYKSKDLWAIFNAKVSLGSKNSSRPKTLKFTCISDEGNGEGSVEGTNIHPSLGNYVKQYSIHEHINDTKGIALQIVAFSSSITRSWERWSPIAYSSFIILNNNGIANFLWLCHLYSSISMLFTSIVNIYCLFTYFFLIFRFNWWENWTVTAKEIYNGSVVVI